MRLIILALVFCAALPVFHAGAEDVIVTYKDGRKEKGELVSADTEKVVVRVSLGGNKLDMKIPWDRIEKLDNGLTRETVEQKWREQNKDKLCGVCNGQKKTTCATCNGAGVLAKNTVDCKACAASGKAACTAKGCTQGKADCPGKCLKLSEGKWTKGREDLRWQRFDFAGGYMEWSERHLGEVIETKDGKPVNTGKCATCGGTTKVDCKACAGQGRMECAGCKGAGKVPDGVAPKCADCKTGKRDCAACKGSGLKQDK